MNKENNLFKSSEDWENNACVNFGWSPDYGYAMGYKEIADLAVVNAASTNRQDFLVYPIAHNYRQYIELRLKNLIDKARQLVDIGHGFPQHHNIKKLWDEIKGVLAKFDKAILALPEFKFTESVINDYYEIDPNSMAFRYPTDKDGKYHLEGMRHINLRHLAESMKKVEVFLENTLYMLIEHLSYKQACEAHFSY